MNHPFSLSATGLKLIAALTMFIDHVGLLFFPEELLFRIVGRISFPLFALLIAEGFEKTGHLRNYVFRLLAFAAISQLPYSLFIQTSGASFVRLNIFFTLAGGLLAIMLLRKLRLTYAVPAVLGIIALAEYVSFDYGVYGILTVLASSLFLRARRTGTVLLLGLPFLRALMTFFSSKSFILQGYASLSVPFVMAYNGAYGRRFPRLLFYAFYPAHLLLLALVWLLIH